MENVGIVLAVITIKVYHTDTGGRALFINRTRGHVGLLNRERERETIKLVSAILYD